MTYTIKPLVASAPSYPLLVTKPPRPPAVEVLKESVARLVDRAGSQPKLHSETKVPQKTISRLSRGDNPATIQTVDELAVGAGFEAWQLLVPGFDPNNPPVVSGRYPQRLLGVLSLLELIEDDASLAIIEQMAAKLADVEVPPTGATDGAEQIVSTSRN